MDMEQIVTMSYGQRETGVYFGRPVTRDESLHQPIREVLGQLGVDIPSICPHGLMSKEDNSFVQPYVAQWEELKWMLAEQETYRAFEASLVAETSQTCQEENPGRRGEPVPPMQLVAWRSWHVQPDNLLDMLALAKRLKLSGMLDDLERCPECLYLPNPASGNERLTHWQQSHLGQHLTYRQARWLLNCSLARPLFLELFPPDYRAPHAREQGIRFWRLETICRWLGEKEGA